DIACPIGAILSVAMMLRESFALAAEAAAIESCVDRILDRGYRTVDLSGPLSTRVSCSRFTAMVREELWESLTRPKRQDSASCQSRDPSLRSG
ncbi:MAG TPA: isocitrate/isopropylmalate family dehydrogenase, partial [Candidatus Acidoferrales bacterium]|nr:isocitrate/isopropylmalate family dehydrogenase [Candidatus Acidoferrales bacterium]